MPSGRPGSSRAWQPGHSAVILGQGHADLGRAVARTLPDDLPVVVDCYAPGIIEAIALNEDPGMFPGFLARTVELLRRGDLFLVANAPAAPVHARAALGRGPPEPHDLRRSAAARGALRRARRTARCRRCEGRAGRARARGCRCSCSGTAASTRGSTAPRPCAASRARCERVPNAWFVIVGGRHPRAHAPDARLLEALAAAQRARRRRARRRGPLGALRRAHRLVRRGGLRDLPAPPRPRDRAVAPHAPRRPALGRACPSSPLPATSWVSAPPLPAPGISVPIGDAEAAGDALVELLGEPRRSRRRARAAADRLAPSSRGRACWSRSSHGSSIRGSPPIASRPPRGRRALRRA